MTVFILINLYNPNTEKEKVSTWEKLNLMLQTFDDLENKIKILGSDFNLFVDSVLQAEGGSPVLKKFSVSQLIEIKEKCKLCDIWRIRNTEKKTLHISTKTSLKFSTKEIRISFCFKYLARIN